MNATTATVRRVNVTLGGAVHAGTQITVDGKVYAANPKCGGNKGGARYKITGQAVTCKKCLKSEAERAAEIAAAEAEAYEMAAEMVAAAEVVEVVETPAAEMVAAPVAAEIVETVILTDKVTTSAAGILSGPLKVLKALRETGAARMDEDGNLRWNC